MIAVSDMAEGIGSIILIVVVWAGFAAVPVVLAVRLGVRIWRRFSLRTRLQQWALQHGWTFRDLDLGLTSLQSGTPFAAVSGSLATEVLSGTYQGMPATSFRLTIEKSTVEVGGVQQPVVRDWHVVAVALPAPLPRIEVTPERPGAALGRLVGMEDMQLESESFNEAYRVTTADPRTAHAVLHPRLMERLLQPDARRSPWRIQGGWVATWRTGATDLQALDGRLGLLAAIVGSVPRHVWLDHGVDPNLRPVSAS